MELSPLQQARRISWGIMHVTHTAGLAQMAIECVVPSQHVKHLLEGAEEEARQREAARLRGIGLIALAELRGELKVDPQALDSVMRAVTAGTAGVELDEVFDPHQAKLLRRTKPILAPKGEYYHDI